MSNILRKYYSITANHSDKLTQSHGKPKKAMLSVCRTKHLFFNNVTLELAQV